MTTRASNKKTAMALFDSDCLEVAGPDSRRSKVLPGFGIRSRMQPMADQLDALYDFAKKQGLVMVFTHCCSSNPVKPGQHPDVLVVPMDPADQSWTTQLDRYRLINIEKHNATPLNRSFICRHFDAFQHNSNSSRLLQLLNIPRWILFGHGFDLCVDSAAKGIIAAGYQVHLLTDVIASSAPCYGPYGTEDSKRSILAYLQKIGVTTGTVADLLTTCP